MGKKPTYGELEQEVTNLTERKQAEEALRKSEEKFKHLTEKLSDVVLTITLDGSLSYVSPVIKEFGGYDPKEEVGNNIAKYFAKKSELIAALNLIDEISINKKSSSIEFLFKPKNIEPFYVEVTGKPLIRKNRVVSIQCVMRDISKRKQAEDALLESEERYRSLFKNNHSVMLLINPKTADIVDANPAAISYYGWSHEELACKKITNINKLTEEQVFQEMEQAKKEHRQHFYFQHVLADGDIRDVEVYSGPIQLQGEQLLYSIIHDITDRKQAEEALKDSEATLTSIFRAAPTGIGMVSDRLIKQANERFCKMIGYSREELLGKSARMIYPNDEEYDYVGRKKYAQISKRGAGTVETRWQRKDGKVIDVLLSSTPMDPNDFSKGVIFTALDITRRKYAEHALRESEEKYRQLVKHAPSGIYEIDYKKGIIVSVNDLMCEYSGYTREELLSMNPFDFLTEDSKKLYSERIEKMVSGVQVPEKVEFKIRRKDGKEIWVVLNIRFVYEDGNIKGATVVAHDINDRKRAEEILRKAHDGLEDKIRERTAELEKSKSKLIKEIKEHKKTEKKLRKREKELENKTDNLEELNAALKVLLDKRGEDKIELQDNILLNVKTLIEPYVDKLKQYRLLQGQKTLINILESNLNEIVTPFTRKLSSKLLNLSPSEIQVANLVKYGKTNKEIAEMLHVTKRTIEFHRENIRKKLGIKNQKTNLKTYLMSLD